MKTSIAAAALSTTLALSANAQGLLSVGSPADFKGESPLTFSAAATVGYDTNTFTSGTNEVASTFVQGGVGATYGWTDRITSVELGLEGSVVHYLESDGIEGVELDETDYNARVTLNVNHQFTPRLTLGNSFYLAYEIEPDYEIGASALGRNGQYFYFFNSVNLSYAWSRRLSTVAGYTVSGVRYDDEEFQAEDRFEHQLSLQGRWLLSRTTSAIVEYRFVNVDYDANLDSLSHILMVGADHSFSPSLEGTIRAGAQYYENDADYTETLPYAEGALRYMVDRQTTLRWYNRLGMDYSETSGFDRRYSYRTGLTGFHAVSDRLTGNAGVHYTFSEFASEAGNMDEHSLNANVGVGYRVLDNAELNAGYNFTNVISDSEFREYDRHRVSLGLAAQF